MKRYILIPTIALITIGCSKVSIPETDTTNPNEIKIQASYPSTKVSDTGFIANDEIGLYAVEYINGLPQHLQVGGNYLNNERFIFDGAAWTGERKAYWSTQACDFYAYYPYQKLTSVDSQIFQIATDQSTPQAAGKLSGYEASDLLWAKAENISREQGVVNLEFNHMMSRLVVKIVKGSTFVGELPEDIVVHIYNTVTSASVNFTKGSLERYTYGKIQNITARKTGKDTFDAIVVPQNIDKRTPLIEITMDGISYLLDYSMSFRPGVQYLIEVIVNTSPDQEKIEISIDGNIQNW